MRPQTFRARVARSMTLLCVAVLAAACVLILIGVHRELLANLDRQVLSIALSEIASGADDVKEGLHVHEEPAVPIRDSIGWMYTKYVQIETDDGRIAARTANLKRGPELATDAGLKRAIQPGQAVFAYIPYRGQTLRAIYYRFPTGPFERAVAIVAVSPAPTERFFRAIAVLLALALVGGGFVARLTAVRLARRLTHPIEEAAAAARSVHELDHGVRLPATSGDAEIQDLMRGLNTMLDRLEASFADQAELLEAQRRFTADAAHELRSPLTNLQGTLEVALMRDRSPEDYKEALEVSLTQAQRLSRLANDLLTLSRAESRTLLLDLAPRDLVTLAGESVDAFRVRSERAGVKLTFRAPEPVLVVADETRIRQVIGNLLENALAHAPAGTEVAVTVVPGDREGYVSISDQGPGLAPEETERVFRRFYRADPARDRDSGGAGLGLAIARAIAEAHGGHLWVESVPGVRTAFSVALPVAFPTATPPDDTLPARGAAAMA